MSTNPAKSPLAAAGDATAGVATWAAMACGAGPMGKGQTRTKVMAKTNATTTGRRCMGSLRAPSRSRRPPATCHCAEGSEAYRAAAYAPQSIVAATTECTHVSSMSWRGVSGCIRLSPRGRPLNRHPASGAAHRCQPLHGEVCNAVLDSEQVDRLSVEEVIRLRQSLDEARRRFVSEHLVSAANLVEHNP